MTRRPPLGQRRWLLAAVGVSLVLYGIAGFPTPNDPDPEVARADRQRRCLTMFWGEPVDPPICGKVHHVHEEVCTASQHRHGAGLQCHSAKGCHNGQHRHGSGCHNPGTKHAPPPTTTTTTPTNQGGTKLGGGGSGSSGKTDTNTCGANYVPDSNAPGGCRIVYSKTAPCARDTMRRDPISQLCYEVEADIDRDAWDGTKERGCPDRKQWWRNGRCVVRLPDDSDERQKNCPTGMAFYSTLGCAYPCDAGQTVVDGQCVTVQHTPPPPQNPTPQNPQNPQNPPPPPAQCPPGFAGTPPNCRALPNPTAYVLMAGDGTVNESTANATVIVTLSSPATEPATVVLATTNGTATAGSDYTALTAQTGAVEFAAGDQQQRGYVAIIDDDRHEPRETFTVSVASASGGAQAPPEGSSAEATIVDNDPVAYVAAAGDLVVDEGVGAVTVTVTLSLPATKPATVVLATANGSAAAGSDYTPLTAQTGTVQFAAGDKQKQLTAIVIIDDTIDEPDETFTVKVASASGGAQVPPEGSSVEFTIVDNDPTPLAAANFTIECGPDADGKLRVKFLWDHPPEDDNSGSGLVYDLKVGYSPDRYNNSWTGPRRPVRNSDGELVGGFDSADPSGDGRPWNAYTNGFRAGATVYASIIPARFVQKTITRGDREIPVTEIDYGRNNHNYAAGACPSGPAVSLTPATLSVAESNGTAELMVSLSEAWGADVTVNVTTANGEGGATAGADYTAPPSKVIIAAGETKASVSVAILDDEDGEADETFTVTISGPTGGARLSSDTESTVTITDNDADAEQQQETNDDDTPKFLS